MLRLIFVSSVSKLVRHLLDIQQLFHNARFSPVVLLALQSFISCICCFLNIYDIIVFMFLSEMSLHILSSNGGTEEEPTHQGANNKNFDDAEQSAEHCRDLRKPAGCSQETTEIQAFKVLPIFSTRPADFLPKPAMI